jgi:hypothetical protein
MRELLYRPRQVAALVEEDHPEVGSNAANGELGEVVAEVDGSPRDDWLALS